MDAGAALVTVEALRDAVVTIRVGLEERIRGGMRVPQALDEVYATLYAGQITEDGRLLFRQLCARMARHIALEYADRTHSYAPWKATGAEVRAWLYWLERQDRMGAQVMDLCYFAGFGVKRAARVVGLDPPTILRVLREQKAHLSYSLPPLPVEKSKARRGAYLSWSTGHGITLRTDLETGLKQSCGSCSTLPRVAVADGSGSAWLAQRRTTSFFFSRANSRKRALIAANRPGGMNP